jgi:O-antigen chain-terminating methyltransferase
VASQRDLTGELVEEIRAAVAEASPAPSVRPAMSLPEGEEVRVTLNRALQYVTPTIPSAVRLSRAKRFLLRALRFLWRDQASFNALMLEASSNLTDLVEAVRGQIQGALDAERDARMKQFGHFERIEAQLLEVTERAIPEWERRSAIQDARLAILEAGPRSGTTPSVSREAGAHAPPPLPAGVYSLFEERFRGSPQDITEKQRSYVPLLRGLPGPVLDIGCGRGELLRLLAQESIPASGVELNPIAASACREEGLAVEEGDGIAVLSGKADGSLGGVVALQVVEHWSAEAIFAFLRQARRALGPGGVLIAETVNTDSLSSLKAFFLDPSHVRPIPADALRFLAQAAGFTDTRIEYRAPLPERERLEENSENDAKLNRLLFGPQDYAMIARVPRAIVG